MPDPVRLLAEIDALIEQVMADASQRNRTWSHWDIRPDFAPSAENLAAYLALRHHDLRTLQRSLMVLGLSSLGRLESRVLPTLNAVRTALSAFDGTPFIAAGRDAAFFAGEQRLSERARRLFGPERHDRAIALLVTCPSEAADDPAFMYKLAQHGVEAVRINCAHDGAEQWARMIAHARAAETALGCEMKIFMDIAGPKIRTGKVRARHHAKRISTGDQLAMVAPGALRGAIPPNVAAVFECTLAEAVTAARAGQRLMIDDGKIVATIDSAQGGVIIATVTHCKEGGVKLKPEKGINLPDTALHIPALTDKDRDDLAFIAAHADGIEFSFVQSAEDVVMLQEALAARRPDDWRDLSLILKIETARALRNLPDIVVRAGAQQKVAIMIARGDLAMEIGYARMAEMQEEILWIAEAAQIPVIWATQVLEQFVKEGMPSRGELTDAAMSARAECVMLNKGPYLFEAIEALAPLLGRMEDHLHKKTPQLRRLTSW